MGRRRLTVIPVTVANAAPGTVQGSWCVLSEKNSKSPPTHLYLFSRSSTFAEAILLHMMIFS